MDPNISPQPPAPSIGQDQHDNPGAGLTVVKRRRWRLVIGLVIGAMVLAVAGLLGWYNYQLQPVSSDAKLTRIEIVSGSTPSQIGALLADNNLIRSQRAFEIHTRLSGTRDKLQAGSYSLAPAQSTPDIVATLTSGKIDEFQLTFLPGGTVMQAKEVLVRAGYSEAEVDAAFAKQYDHPVFADKPADADLEGYIYGETYSFATTSTVDAILKRTFDELYSVIQANSLEAAYEAKGLNLYEGITLASIIQREVGRPDDQKQVSQVFHTRLSIDMPLGADATFVYAAKKMGVAPQVNLNSPYNTRINGGLPPGPISSPGESALIATAQPAEGDYLYFVSGDDGRNYFSRTLEEHESNTAKYCQKNCQLF